MTVRVSRRALLAAPMAMAPPVRAWPKAPIETVIPAAPGGPQGQSKIEQQ